MKTFFKVLIKIAEILRIVLNFASIVAGICFIAISIWRIITYAIELKKCSKTRSQAFALTEAKVKAVQYPRFNPRRSRYSQVVFVYEYNGVQYQKTASLYNEDVRKGDEYELVIVENAPENALMRDGTEESSLRNMIFVSVIALIFAALIFLFVLPAIIDGLCNWIDYAIRYIYDIFVGPPTSI